MQMTNIAARRGARSVCGALVVFGAMASAGPGNAVAQAASHGGSVVRLQVPRGEIRQRRPRFHGQIALSVPSSWQGHASRQHPNEASLTIRLSSGCTVSANASTIVTRSRDAASVQLRTGVPAASEPGEPTPIPVITLAKGSLTLAVGVWLLVEPPKQANTWLQYGAALSRVSNERWAGVRVGVTTGRCPVPPIPQLVTQVASVLRKIRPVGVSFR